MATQLNIKDGEVIRLAKELAGRTGRSVTSVIRSALEGEWNRQEDVIAEKVRQAKAISAEFRQHMPREWHNMSSKQIMDEIYAPDIPAAAE